MVSPYFWGYFQSGQCGYFLLVRCQYFQILAISIGWLAGVKIETNGVNSNRNSPTIAFASLSQGDDDTKVVEVVVVHLLQQENLLKLSHGLLSIYPENLTSVQIDATQATYTTCPSSLNKLRTLLTIYDVVYFNEN